MELGRARGPLDGSLQPPPQKCAGLSCLRGPAGTRARGAGVGTRGCPPRSHPPTLAGLTGVWPRPPPPGTKAACPGRGRGRGAAPRPVPIPLRSPHGGSGSPERGCRGPEPGRGCGFDPFLRSFAPVPLRAFRGAGRGTGDSQAVRLGWPPPPSPASWAPSALPPPAVWGVLPGPSPGPAWPPRTATTVQTRLKRNVNPSPSLLAPSSPDRPP